MNLIILRGFQSDALFILAGSPPIHSSPSIEFVSQPFVAWCKSFVPPRVDIDAPGRSRYRRSATSVGPHHDALRTSALPSHDEARIPVGFSDNRYCKHSPFRQMGPFLQDVPGLAGKSSNTASAKAVFRSATDIFTMTKIYLSIFCNDRF